MASDDVLRLVPVVLGSLTWERILDEFRKPATAANPRFFFPAFGIDRADIGDDPGFSRLEGLVRDLMSIPAIAGRTGELRDVGLIPEIVVYDEPAGHFLPVRIEVTPRGREALEQFKH